MVRISLSMIMLILLLLTGAVVNSAQAAFVSVSGSQIKLGEALRLKVRVVEGESLQYVLSQLPWQQWQEHFAVELHSHGSERATYYLYPYQLGQFELAASRILAVVRFWWCRIQWSISLGIGGNSHMFISASHGLGKLR
ncbi:exported hypothetical protein [uncultured Thiomicrorhabdus sp.]